VDIETFRERCLAVAGSTESTPFIDRSVVVFKVAGKMFAYLDIDPRRTADGFRAAMKCAPERSRSLRERYADIAPTMHDSDMWNLIALEGDVPDALIAELVAHAAAEVVRALPRKRREEYLAEIECLSTT